MSLVNDIIVRLSGAKVVCLGKGWLSVLDPMDKVPQDENKTKSSHGNCLFLCDSCPPLLLEILDKTLRCLVKIQHVNVLGVPFPEEEWLEQLPDLLVAPVLDQDVSRVLITINMIKSNDGSCNGFTYAVK